jgi:uncharacterized protein YciI
MTIKYISLAILSLGFFSCSFAQKNVMKENELKPYYVVLLKKGPHRDQDSVSSAQIQKAHLEYISKLAESGKLNIAGPFLDEGPLRGIFIFDSNSENEVKDLVTKDPAVHAGRLEFEIHPWMTQKGSCFK